MLRNVKSSLCSDEIAAAVGRFNFTETLVSISSKANAFDFTVRSTISLTLAVPPLLGYNTFNEVSYIWDAYFFL